MRKLKNEELTELDKLRYWLDCEVTILHIQWAILLGVIVGGTVWWFVGAYIFISFIYSAKRASVLPRDYLRVKHERRSLK
jgi:hypothetical protein